MKDVIVVTGATGHVGQDLVQRLLSAGQIVRAVARNVSRLKPLGARGAEMWPGSLADPDFLTSVFRGATTVFAVIPQSNLSAQDPFAEHTGYAKSLVGAIRAAGVNHVVGLSSWGAELPGQAAGAIAPLHVFEELLDDVPGLSVVHLRPGHFMENRLWDIGLIKSAGILGSMIEPNLSLPMVATPDIAAVAAEYLTNVRFKGRSVRYVLGPKDYTMTEATRILGASIGKPGLKYVEFPEAIYRKGLASVGFSSNLADAYVEMVRGFNSTLIKGEPRSEANTTPTTLEEFAKPVFAPAFKATPDPSLSERLGGLFLRSFLFFARSKSGSIELGPHEARRQA
ncbi:MAG: NmrA family NAD(P)-binding protein [Armatimonadota bacterium]